MAQIKVFGLESSLRSRAEQFSTAIHEAVMDALAYPPDKKFHRFIALDKNAFFYPDSRSRDYTIIEISMFEGRSIDTKKRLIRQLFQNIERDLGISSDDVEITISETPKYNWGIRGTPGDELALDYKVNI